MEKANEIYQTFSDCAKKIRAIDDTLQILSRKWTIVLLAHLCFKPLRYSELMKELDIQGKVLSRELKDLEMNGLVSRQVSQGQPVTVTYELTDYGKTLLELTDNIAEWGFIHRSRIFNTQVVS